MFLKSVSSMSAPPKEAHFLWEMKIIFHLLLETRSRFFTRGVAVKVKNNRAVRADILLTKKS